MMAAGAGAAAALPLGWAALEAHRDDDRLKDEVESALRRLDAGLQGENGASRQSEVGPASKTRLPLGGKAKVVATGTLMGMITPKGRKSRSG